MAKKMFIPARLSKAAGRWEIVYYQTDPKTGLRKRLRETRDLNRIQDLKLRETEAAREVRAINKLLPGGYPFDAPKSDMGPTIFQAIEKARDIKIKNSNKDESHRSYRSQFAVFTDFLAAKKLTHLPALQFSKIHVAQFIDFLRHERKWKRGKSEHTGLSNKKVNDYQSSISSMFNELIDSGILEQNPFWKKKRLKAGKTKRRGYNDEERAAIFRYFYEKDRRIFYASILQFYCLIRGEALRELRFSMFDLQKGVIHLPETIEKNAESATKTIPAKILHFFLAADFIDFPANWLVFGFGLRPNPTKKTGRSSFNLHFQAALGAMKKAGLIENVVGLSFYSNKNAGITKMVAELGIVPTMDQAAHKDPKTTMIYRDKPTFNQAVRDFSVGVFE